MKSVKIILFALLLLMTACAMQNPTDAVPLSTDEVLVKASSPIPLYFDSEEALFQAIYEVHGENGKADTIVVNSKTLGKQSYSANLDASNLASVSEFYRPMNILEGLSFQQIAIKDTSIVYYYANEDQIICATFIWLREMPPEVHMNELYGRGALSERELEYDGTSYVFLEWMDPATGDSVGYTINWVVAGRSYSAGINTGYTDEEMLAFCQFEVVVVE